ncbi:hypothetical protein M413DRAFT_260625 [Hebeloma cylindrosporum]|uniref:F-box domain-containing protein n=1 Tax=Hebeloma cylindrosporum TaxID=76867 RepID=A0A0C3CRI0_HEBCY|nr:hypothetical protein M413DRAFT_260625 [Hebeloma cylindrosporum h7]
MKTLRLTWRAAPPAAEDFERFLQGIPCFQDLRITCRDGSELLMDNILERISASPPPRSPLQTDNTAGFLSDLRILQLIGGSLHAWRCIPLIFQWPHRKRLTLDINLSHADISREVLDALVGLPDEGIDLRISNRSNDGDDTEEE